MTLAAKKVKVVDSAATFCVFLFCLRVCVVSALSPQNKTAASASNATLKKLSFFYSFIYLCMYLFVCLFLRIFDQWRHCWRRLTTCGAKWFVSRWIFAATNKWFGIFVLPRTFGRLLAFKLLIQPINQSGTCFNWSLLYLHVINKLVFGSSSSATNWCRRFFCCFCFVFYFF